MKDKVVLITGGTSGIGEAAAKKFGAAGAKVVVSGRREAEGGAVVESIRSAGGEAAFIRADVAEEAEVKALVEAAVGTYGGLDVAFNNAGVEYMGPITDATVEDYSRVMGINVWGVLSAMKYEIPAMLAGGGGSIINTSSVAGHIGMAGLGIYVASKHAVEGLTKVAALEYSAAACASTPSLRRRSRRRWSTASPARRAPRCATGWPRCTPSAASANPTRSPRPCFSWPPTPRPSSPGNR